MQLPPSLKIGDEIRIISPSGNIAPELIDGAKSRLQKWRLSVSEGAFARSSFGRFAGTKEERINDLQQALDDNSVKAILCSRGGYGLSQIIDKIDFSNFVKQPKWLIGFSDVTILHNAISLHKIASLHAVMAKGLSELSSNAASLTEVKKILFGGLPRYSVPVHRFNRAGEVNAKLIGGNLAVFMGLRATPYDLDFKDSILFMEDIGEKPYQVDRMIQNLRISGALSRLSGLVVGQFAEYEEDAEMKQSLYGIIADAVKEYDYPVCFGFPAGHVDYNLPLIIGKEYHLEVGETEVLLG